MQPTIKTYGSDGSDGSDGYTEGTFGYTPLLHECARVLGERSEGGRRG